MAMTSSWLRGISPLTLRSLRTMKSTITSRWLLTTPSQLQKRLEVGDKQSLSHTIALEDVRKFAELTLDDNPLHVDPEYAKTTRFGKPIVHGMFCLSILGGLLGGNTPGPGSVLMGVTMNFTAPLFVGDAVRAETVIEKIEGRKITYEATCYEAKTDKVLSKGQLFVLVPKHLVREEK